MYKLLGHAKYVFFEKSFSFGQVVQELFMAIKTVTLLSNLEKETNATRKLKSKHFTSILYINNYKNQSFDKIIFIRTIELLITITLTIPLYERLIF